MFEDVQTPQDIEDKMKELRDTSCSGLSAVQFSEFARRVASIIPREGGMRRGIVNRLGELWTSVRFGLKLMPEGTKGYDAVDTTGRLGARDKWYQIKSRHPEKGERVNPMGTTPRFTSLEFNWALLVLMDKDLQNYEIWRAAPASISKHLRTGRNDMHVLQFQTIGHLVYSS